MRSYTFRQHFGHSKRRKQGRTHAFLCVLPVVGALSEQMCVCVFCARVLCVLMRSCMYPRLFLGSMSDTPNPKKQGRTHAFLCVLPSICNTSTRKQARSHAFLCVLPIVWSPPRASLHFVHGVSMRSANSFHNFPRKTSVKIILV